MPNNGSMDSNYVIDIKNLSLWLSGDLGKNQLHVLDNITLSVRIGETVAIVGPSGSGKTTLLRVIAGLLCIQRGEIRLWGQAPHSLEREHELSFVFQSPILMPWRTVLENVRLPLELKDVRDGDIKAKEVVALVGLNGFEDFYPYELSGGMRTRVNLGRALIGQPDLLLLDEPFAHLDELSRLQLAKEVLDIREMRPITIVLVTHDISEAVLLSDRVIILSSRPASVQTSLDISLPYPRSIDLSSTPVFQRFVTSIRSTLETLSYR
jgi:NitT/TauT family transport system ATP-binding protein